jgi:signal transduction histidine kinase/ActR/RegA family two-component response regulator
MTHLACLMLCAVAFLSFGLAGDRYWYPRNAVIAGGALFFIYCARVGCVNVISKKKRLTVLAENTYLFLLLAMVLAFIIITGNLNSQIKVLLLVPVIIISSVRGQRWGMCLAAAIGLFLLVDSLIADHSSPNKFFEMNLVFTWVMFLVGWFVGSITDIETHLGSDLLAVNKNLEENVDDKMRNLKNLDNELRALKRVYDTMHSTLQETTSTARNLDGIRSVSDLALTLQSKCCEEALAERLVPLVQEITEADATQYFIFEREQQILRLKGVAGFPSEAADREKESLYFTLGDERGLVNLAAIYRKPIYEPDVCANPRWISDGRNIGSCYIMPVYYGETMFGVYTLLSLDRDGFSEEQRALADNIAFQISAAMENARLFTETQHIFEALNVTQQQLLQSQKMEAIGQLAGGIAHDLNNQLTVIQGSVDLNLNKLIPDERVYRDLLRIRRATERSANLTRQLMLFGRKQPLFKVPLNVNNNISELQEMLKRLISEDVQIDLDLADCLYIVRADATNLDQVVINLVLNARDAMPDGGRILIGTENVQVNEDYLSHMSSPSVPGNYVRISVSDNGIGISEDVRVHLFEPFFTTKEPNKGTGLGLSVAYGIIKAHQGWINVVSQPGQGATFEVYLPTISEDIQVHDNQPISKVKVAIKNNGEKILLVEDELDVLSLTKELLTDNGYQVLTSTTVAETLQVFEKEKDLLDLVICDVVLPDGRGVDLVHRLLERQNKLKVLMVSGYAGDRSRMDEILRDHWGFLSKPFTRENLLQWVQEVLSKSWADS